MTKKNIDFIIQSNRMKRIFASLRQNLSQCISANTPIYSVIGLVGMCFIPVGITFRNNIDDANNTLHDMINVCEAAEHITVVENLDCTVVENSAYEIRNGDMSGLLHGPWTVKKRWLVVGSLYSFE